MLKSYLKIALRQLWKNKLFSSLNILGLATSMSVCLLIIMIVTDQYSYDVFHEKGDRIYRVISASEEGITPHEPNLASTSLAVATDLKEDFPFVESVVRILPIRATINIEEKIFESEVAAYLADQDLLETFSFGWIAGDQRTALLRPRTVVLTESTAKRFFPNRDPMGASIELQNLGDFTVSGILPDPPRRSHIRFDYLISFATKEVLTQQELEVANIYDEFYYVWKGYVYILLKKGIARTQLDEALAGIAHTYTDKMERANFLFTSQSLLDINPSKDLGNEIGKVTPEIIFFILMALGLIIICAACFNYTSLSIARSLKRTGEIGVRKVIGARKKDIIFQFLGESILLALVSLLVAIGLLELLVPAFYNLDPDMTQYIALERTPQMYFMFFVFSVVVGGVAGLLPALNIARLKPIHAIQKLSNLKVFSRSLLQKILVTIQFALSLIFVLTVIVLMQQKNHVLNADYGINVHNIFKVTTRDVDYEIFAQKVRQIPNVEEVSASSLVLLTHTAGTIQAQFNDDKDSIKLFQNAVSPNYLKTMKIKLIAGKPLPTIDTQKEQFVLINQKAAERMGYNSAEEAIGGIIKIDTSHLSIIGVTADFYHNGIWFEPIKPFVLRQNINQKYQANIRFSESYSSNTIASIRSIWKELSPSNAMNGYFIEDKIFRLTKFFRMGSHIIGFVGFLSILIACMGLLGMVIYTIEARLKEVSIRKILGASKSSIIWQLSKGFFILLGIAILIATPLTIFGANLWLQNFANRMAITPILVLSGISILLGLGLVTVISQTYLAASANPVDSLHSE